MQTHSSVSSGVALVEPGQTLTEQYEELDVIGQGSFGVIRKVRRLADGKILARKEIDYRKMSIREKEQLVSEVNILKDLKHPNIVDFIERVIDREKSIIYIIMEYCEYGDLATVIRNHKEKGIPIEEDYVWSILTQLVLALHECHCGTVIDPETKQPKPRPVLHRDLKPDNVFLMSKWCVKLGDFGLSRSLTNPRHAFAQTFVGTPYYMSPELISEASYGPKSDIWSLGCIIYELCALEPPFLAKSQASLATKIRQGIVPRLPSQYSTELSEVIRAMLRVDPSRRPSTQDLLDYKRIKLLKMDLDNQQNAAKIDADRHAIEMAKRELLAKEQRLHHAQQLLETKDAQLQARENWCDRREAELKQREELIQVKMIEMEAKWEEIQALEKQLQQQLQQQQQQQQHLQQQQQQLQQVVPVSAPVAPQTTLTSSIMTSTSKLSLSGRNSFPTARPFVAKQRTQAHSSAASSATASAVLAPPVTSTPLNTGDSSAHTSRVHSRVKEGRKSNLPAARLTTYSQSGTDQQTSFHSNDQLSVSASSISSLPFSSAAPSTASRDRPSFKWTMPTARQSDKPSATSNFSLTTMKPPAQQDAVAPQRPLSALNLGRHSEHTSATSPSFTGHTASNRTALARMRAKSRSATSLASTFSPTFHAPTTTTTTTPTSTPDRPASATNATRPDTSSTTLSGGQPLNGHNISGSMSMTSFGALTATLHANSGKTSPPNDAGGGGGDARSIDDEQKDANNGHRPRGEHPRSASASSSVTTTPLRFQPLSMKNTANGGGGPRASWAGSGTSHINGTTMNNSNNVTFEHTNGINKSMSANGNSNDGSGSGGSDDNGDVPRHPLSESHDGDENMDWDADDLPSPFIKKTYLKS
ncbi:G2-specific serine/threonine protein kinase [Actinomortierella wolfii]|nr:G2-specific serine/threonine protein kinase [Actinomortierella wolfii]